MKLHKVELYIVDFEGYGLEEFLLNLDLVDGYITHSFKGETVEMPYVDWSDEHSLNQHDVTQSVCEKAMDKYRLNHSSKTQIKS